jgi:hypothetical protein
LNPVYGGHNYLSIPYFLAAVIVGIMTTLFAAWYGEKRLSYDPGKKGSDVTAWLLLGLALIAIFALGAFVMYVLL